MAWIKYVGICIAVIVVAFIIAGVLEKKKTDEFFGRTNSSAMKGFAILAIMLCHFMGAFGGGITLFTPLGGIGVSIFLLLSAYGLNESYTCGGDVLVA